MSVLERHSLSDSDSAAAVVQGLTAIVLECALDMGTTREQFLQYMNLMYEKYRKEPENMINSDGGRA